MRSRRGLSIFAALVAVLAAAAARADTTSLELAVKATYLYKLAPFVSWPAPAVPIQGPFVLCVQGADPFGSLLDKAVAGQTANGRPIAVRRLARLEPEDRCQIAFLAGSSSQTVGQALQATRGTPVLTVTDAARGGAHGVVHFVRSGGKVRFSIDTSLAQENGVTVSSKLLALAVAVTR